MAPLTVEKRYLTKCLTLENGFSARKMTQEKQEVNVERSCQKTWLNWLSVETELQLAVVLAVHEFTEPWGCSLTVWWASSGWRILHEDDILNNTVWSNTAFPILSSVSEISATGHIIHYMDFPDCLLLLLSISVSLLFSFFSVFTLF